MFTWKKWPLYEVWVGVCVCNDHMNLCILKSLLCQVQNLAALSSNNSVHYARVQNLPRRPCPLELQVKSTPYKSYHSHGGHWWVSFLPYQICSSASHGSRTHHCCAWPARAIVTSTTSDPAPMTTASRLCTRDPLPPVVSRSFLAGQVDASSRGQGICPARGWHRAGACCGLAHLVIGGKHVLAANVTIVKISFISFCTEKLGDIFSVYIQVCRL